MLIRGLGHIKAAGTPHLTTHLTERFFSPPSSLYNIPIYTVILPQALPLDINLNGILPSPPVTLAGSTTTATHTGTRRPHPTCAPICRQRRPC